MLVYIASFPRSGNTLARNLIHHYFDVWTSSVYREKIYPNFPSTTDREDNRFLKVTSDQGFNYRIVKNGCLYNLTVNFRRELAESSTVYFIKSHEHPFYTYLEGEYVLQIVRHPGPTLWSFYKYLRDYENKKSIRVSNVIKGNTVFGSWSTYHRRWRLATPMLAGRYFRFQFDELVTAEMSFIEKLSFLTALNSREEPNSFPSFRTWQEKDPIFYRSGKSGSWQQEMSLEHKRLITKHHSDEMLIQGFTNNRLVETDPETASILKFAQQLQSESIRKLHRLSRRIKYALTKDSH